MQLPHPRCNVPLALLARQLVLVGHDWGGNLAWVTAALAPALFSHLVVLCCPHPACFRRNIDWDQFKRSW